MSIPQWPNKDPGDSRQYAIDFGPDLTLVDGTVSGTLTAAPWTVPPGLTKVNEGIVGNVAVVRLSGGTAGAEYRCTCTATTSTGDTIERSARILVIDR